MKKLFVLLPVLLFPLLNASYYTDDLEKLFDGRIFIKNQRATPLKLAVTVKDGPVTKYPDYEIAAGQTYRIPELAQNIWAIFYKRPPFIYAGRLPVIPGEQELSIAMNQAQNLARSTERDVTLVFSDDKPIELTQ